MKQEVTDVIAIAKELRAQCPFPHVIDWAYLMQTAAIIYQTITLKEQHVDNIRARPV